MKKLLDFNKEKEVLRVPKMEVTYLFYHPLSNYHEQDITVIVDGLGKIEFKDNILSEETKNAIRSDCLLAMKKRLGL